MAHRFLVPLALLASLIVAPGVRAQEITDRTQRQRFLDRMAATYYSLPMLGFMAADCEVHSSMMDDLDTLLVNRFPENKAALKSLRALKPSLHLELQAKPTVDRKTITSGNEEIDAGLEQSLVYSMATFIYAMNTWRLFSNGDISMPSSPLDTGYRIFAEGKGYRVVSDAGMEIEIDSLFRITRYITKHPSGLVSTKTFFRETPHGLLLDSAESSIPLMKATTRIGLEFKETNGVLFPSDVVVSVDSQFPDADGIAPGEMTFTFRLTGCRVRKG